MTQISRVMGASIVATTVSEIGSRVYSIHCSNASSDDCYVKLYNLSHADVAVDSPSCTLSLPKKTSRDMRFSEKGFESPLGISIAATQLAADGDVTNVEAGKVIVHVEWDRIEKR